MSSHPTLCPRCGDLLGMTPGTSLAACIQCGTSYQFSGGEWKCMTETSNAEISTSAVKECSAPPPHSYAPDVRPHQPADAPAAPPAPEPPAPLHRLMIRFDCPKCKAILQSPDNKVGVTVHCPACKQAVQVPKPVNLAKVRWLLSASLLLVALLGGALFAWNTLTSTDGESEAAAQLDTQADGKSHGEKRPRSLQQPSATKPLVRPTTLAKIDKKVPATLGSMKPAPKGPGVATSVPEQAERKIYQTTKVILPISPSPKPGAKRIDELVFGKLKEMGITPAAPCSDAAFLRRVYVDVIGTLPTSQEAETFFEDTHTNKREILIDRLLERKEFADYWAMKWGDILRVKSEFPINLWPNAVRAYHGWIRASIRENLPYDQFARSMLTSSGSNFRSPSVNFYRALQRKEPLTTAHAVALTFMGVRPEGWPTERWSGMVPFFSQLGYKSTLEWKEEIVYFDSRKPLSSSEAAFPDGTRAEFLPDQDPRLAFADWLITPQNPWFTRNIANRVWSWLLGRGIIHEPDDIRPDNPPSNPDLLAHLEQELIAARYDLKHLYRLILNSKTYQLSCIAASEHPEAAAQFASYPVRRLEAEVLIDAICQITGTTERYSSPIPEPFTYLPQGYRAISLPDASITSTFLDMFGRPPRDTGLESERNNTITAAQRLHLLNSSHIQRKIEKGPRLATIFNSGKDSKFMAKELYLAILSRYPTPKEQLDVAEYISGGPRGRSPAMDIAWALINSAEFICRH
jgi:DNA-directed RNA polymerase subunit M/transcription elongation factor TFIIS